MAYIGKTPTIGNFQVCDAISVVNGQAAYTMQVGGVNVSPESANHMIVSLNGVIQKPTDAYTVSNSVISFASNLVTGDVIDFIQILGNVLDLGVPSDSTVSLAKLTATGTKDATTFLRGDNTFNAPPLGGITEVDQWRLSSNLTLATSEANITTNLERVDTAGFEKIGTGMTESSGIFTFPSTGIWLIEANFTGWNNSGGNYYVFGRTKTTVDNSTYVNAGTSHESVGDTQDHFGFSFSTIFDVSNTTTHKIVFSQEASSALPVFFGSTSINYTTFTFIRLGDT